MNSTPATRVLNHAGTAITLLGALAANLAGSNVLLMFAIVAITVAMTIRLYSLTH